MGTQRATQGQSEMRGNISRKNNGEGHQKNARSHGNIIRLNFERRNLPGVEPNGFCVVEPLNAKYLRFGSSPVQK
jgi:hypothetical protein